MLKLANGTEIRAELVGDELCHYWLAADGRATHGAQLKVAM